MCHHPLCAGRQGSPTTEVHSCTFWRPDGQNPGFSRATFSPEAPGDTLPASPTFGGLPAFLGLWLHHFSLVPTTAQPSSPDITVSPLQRQDGDASRSHLAPWKAPAGLRPQHPPRNGGSEGKTPPASSHRVLVQNSPFVPARKSIKTGDGVAGGRKVASFPLQGWATHYTTP